MVLGKTNMDEFGMGSYSTNSPYGTVRMREIGPQEGRIGATERTKFDSPRHLGRNPAATPQSNDKAVSDQNPAEQRLSPRSAGGSSGGSAVAVKEGEVDLALGTDTGGSVRLPAAYTGTVGFKPSYGMISRWGVVPYANSLDTVGFIAQDVKTIESVIADRSNGLWKEWDKKDPTSMSLETRTRCAMQREGYKSDMKNALFQNGNLTGITIGIPKEYNIFELMPVVKQFWQHTAETLRKLGANVVGVSLPMTQHALSTYYILAPAEASSNLAKYDGVRYGARATSDSSDGNGDESILYASTRGHFFGDEVQHRILLGSYTLSSEAMDNYFIKAQRVRRLVRRDFDRIFKLANPLLELDSVDQTFDLTDMDDKTSMRNKLGPDQVDFLLIPTAPSLAPKLDEVENLGSVESFVNDVFTVGASLAGIPAVSIPVGEASDEVGKGFIGMQLIGQYWDDARLLSVAQIAMDAVEN